MEYLFCGNCGEFVNRDECADHEDGTKCPECDKTHEDWAEATHDYVLELISERVNVKKLIDIYRERQANEENRI